MPYRPPYNILTPLLLVRPRIIGLFAEVINHSFQAAEYQHHTQTTEVDRLLYFFVEGLPILESGLRRLLRPYKVDVTISGVFCHQTPRVRSTLPRQSPGECELADMTFISSYGRIIGSNGLGNAMLVQAKNRLGEARSRNQEFLYEEAEEFMYTTPRTLSQVVPPNSNRRDIRTAENALWYWEYDHYRSYRGYGYPHGWSTHGVLAQTRSPDQQLFFTPFEVALFDMIAGVTGKGFHRVPTGSGERGWSHIIDDVLRVTARNLVRSQRSAYIIRGAGHLRGREAHQSIAAVVGQNVSFVARCSLGEVFELMGAEMSNLGKKIEVLNAQFDTEKFRKEYLYERPKARGSGDEGGKPPIIYNDGMELESEDGGHSFVVFRFKSEERDDNDQQLNLAI